MEVRPARGPEWRALGGWEQHEASEHVLFLAKAIRIKEDRGMAFLS